MDAPTFFNGMPVYTSDLLTIGPFEDWSEVRSPGRARRRRRLGHRQRIRFYYLPNPDVLRVGGSLHMHPETARKLMAAIKEQPHD